MIAAIGGGEIKTGETGEIDRYIAAAVKKDAPRVLFIPTASHDSEGYIETVSRVYGALGCSVKALRLFTAPPEPEKLAELFDEADIIYVGGGDTLRMMRCWQRFGVDRLLRRAYGENKVLSGLSAGSICWFSFGHSDSNSFINKDGVWDFIRVYGLALIPFAHCPHYNEPGREGFDMMMKRESIAGVALEDCTALIEDKGRYQIVKSDRSMHAYVLRADGRGIIKTELPEGDVTELLGQSIQ